MFVIGKVVKPQGIRGEVKARIITSFPEHFEQLSALYIEQNEYIKFNIEDMRLSGDFVFIKLSKVDSRNDAESLRNKYLYIPAEELYPLQDDEFYHHQLLGLKVYDQDNVYLGMVKDIESYPVNDILVVENEKNKTFLIPVVKDFIKEIDIESQKVTVHVVEGLLG